MKKGITGILSTVHSVNESNLKVCTCVCTRVKKERKREWKMDCHYFIIIGKNSENNFSLTL